MASFSGAGLGIFLPNVLGIKLGPVASLNHLEVRQKATKTTRKRRSVAWTKRKQHDRMMTETYFPLKLINSKNFVRRIGNWWGWGFRPINLPRANFSGGRDLALGPWLETSSPTLRTLRTLLDPPMVSGEVWNLYSYSMGWGSWGPQKWRYRPLLRVQLILRAIFIWVGSFHIVFFLGIFGPKLLGEMIAPIWRARIFFSDGLGLKPPTSSEFIEVYQRRFG